jgi:tetratricopeptide (TPR) repeat protein/TolB-like protein
VRRRRAALVAILLFGVVTRIASAEEPQRILVMPFENVRRDARIFWLGEAAAVLVADDMTALGGNAIAREERLQAFERLQVPPAALLTDASVIRIGQLVGAGQAIVGSLQLDGDTLIVHARSLALETGRVVADVTDRGPLPDLFAIFQRVARRMTAPSAKSYADVDSQHPSVAAFENYIKGLLAETPDTAVTYLNGALKVQPNFDRVRLALWDVDSEDGEHALALEAVQAVPAGSPYFRRARFLIGLSQLTLKKYDDAFATFKALADQQATPTVLNNLGVVQLRRGSTPQTGLPSYYFNKAVEADPDDPDYFFNLGYAYWEARDPQAAIYWLRESVRHNAADGDAHFVLSAALSAAGNTAEATRERDLARRLSSMYEDWAKRPAADPVPKGLERVKNAVELPHARRIETTLATSERRDQQELTRFYLDRGRRLFQKESDREAVVELNHALYLSPYLADAHLLLGRIHLRNGRIREASDAFKIAIWSAETAEAHAALGEAYRQAKDLPAARAEAERALAIDPASSEAQRLLDMLKSP